MKWKKLGKIFDVDSIELDWMNSHAMMPVVEKYSDTQIRVYFSPRDIRNRSRAASFIFNMDKKEIVTYTKEPLLDLGERGCFDDSGVMPTCIVSLEDSKKYLYYNGWTLGGTIPFFSFNGIAISNDNGETFKKMGRYPVALNRDEIDPYSTFAPFVLKDNDIWKMWYVSLIRWEEENNELKHYYHIKYAESLDGINWKKEGKVCINFKNDLEYAIARPCVIKSKNIYKMWYSYRAGEKNLTYRIGYAESLDGINWERMDEKVNLNVSESGWDSEMICYAYLFEYNDRLYMLYNGNGYGKTGIGLAVLEEE